MAKSIFSRKYAPEISITVVAGFILIIVDRAVPKINLLGMLAEVFVKIHHFKIPGSIFLISLAAVVVLLIALMKSRRPTDAGLGAERAEKAEEAKAEELNLGEEHMLILAILGIVKNDIQDERLFKEYIARHPKRNRFNFKFLIDDLKGEELINISPGVIDDTSYSLSAKGLSFLRKAMGIKKEQDPKAATTKAATAPKGMTPPPIE
jgi:hypothetical protein